jgi:uncharacterized protein YaaW (UPF0174 family)
MSTSKSAIFDEDLNPVLNACTNEELQYLVELLTGTFTNFLEIEPEFQKYYPDHQKYSDLIAAHIRLFGGNSIASFWRALMDDDPNVVAIGPKYKEIVCDVADKLDVQYNKKNSTEEIEYLILKKEIEGFLSKATKEQKDALSKKLEIEGEINTQDFLTILSTSSISLSTLFIASTMSILLLAPAAVIGFLSSPAYRITVPAVKYVAILRKRQKLKKYGAI